MENPIGKRQGFNRKRCAKTIPWSEERHRRTVTFTKADVEILRGDVLTKTAQEDVAVAGGVPAQFQERFGNFGAVVHDHGENTCGGAGLIPEGFSAAAHGAFV